MDHPKHQNRHRITPRATDEAGPARPSTADRGAMRKTVVAVVASAGGSLGALLLHLVTPLTLVGFVTCATIVGLAIAGSMHRSDMLRTLSSRLTTLVLRLRAPRRPMRGAGYRKPDISQAFWGSWAIAALVMVYDVSGGTYGNTSTDPLVADASVYSHDAMRASAPTLLPDAGLSFDLATPDAMSKLVPTGSPVADAGDDALWKKVLRLFFVSRHHAA